MGSSWTGRWKIDGVPSSSALLVHGMEREHCLFEPLLFVSVLVDSQACEYCHRPLQN